MDQSQNIPYCTVDVSWKSTMIFHRAYCTFGPSLNQHWRVNGRHTLYNRLTTAFHRCSHILIFLNCSVLLQDYVDTGIAWAHPCRRLSPDKCLNLVAVACVEVWSVAWQETNTHTWPVVFIMTYELLEFEHQSQAWLRDHRTIDAYVQSQL